MQEAPNGRKKLANMSDRGGAYARGKQSTTSLELSQAEDTTP